MVKTDSEKNEWILDKTFSLILIMKYDEILLLI